MNRVQRALGRTNIDAYLRAEGFRNEAHASELIGLHARLDAGGRITEADIERIAPHYPAIPRELFAKIATHINGGRTGQERADRCVDCVYGRINPASGIPTGASPMREQAREVSRTYATNELAAPLIGKLNERDQHRDKQNGIDERNRVESAKRAALENPANVRRSDIERAIAQHDPLPTLYAADRRELLAQGIERNMDKTRAAMVRDSDPHRLPDRGDDRRDDIRTNYDRALLNELADEELTVAANPVLERVDDAITFDEAQSRATE